MRIQHDTFVLVADGGKMLLFRNGGDAHDPRFETVAEAKAENPPDREQKSDASGRTFSAGRHSTYEETDFHRQEETRFARETATLLDRFARERGFDRLVVVADPRTLGVLRDHYTPRVARLVINEIPRDLVKHPVVDIERALCAEAALR